MSYNEAMAATREPAIGNQRDLVAQAAPHDGAGGTQHFPHSGAAHGAFTPDHHHIPRPHHRYDATGRREINQLIRVVDRVVAQDPIRFGADARAAKDRLFARLGFEHSSWGVQYYGYSWNTSLLDMARLGLTILRGGVYGGERIADAKYVYNMTHPAFEDGSTRYGYLTWLGGTGCAPRPIHRSYPHGLSEATDCEDGNCAQEHDVGAWYAAGAGGQYIIGHRGLDLLVIGKEWQDGGPNALWNLVLPSVVAADPVYSGNQEAFCSAYSAGSYAPDWVPWEDGL
jgi:hypothetical protein